MSRAEIAAEITELPRQERQDLARLCSELMRDEQSLDAEREDWFRAAEPNLSRAYGPDEPEYGPDRIVEPNPLYEP